MAYPIMDIETISEAGFDKYLNRNLYDRSEPWAKRQTDAYNLAGGIIGKGSVIYLGSKLWKMDGANQRQVVNDGVTNRILIGKF